MGSGAIVLRPPTKDSMLRKTSDEFKFNMALENLHLHFLRSTQQSQEIYLSVHMH